MPKRLNQYMKDTWEPSTMFPWDCILYVVPTCFNTIIRCNRDTHISLHPGDTTSFPFFPATSRHRREYENGHRVQVWIVRFVDQAQHTSRETSPIQIGKMSFLSNEWEMLFCSWRVEFRTLLQWKKGCKMGVLFQGFLPVCWVFLFGFVFVVCDVLCRRHFSRRSAADPMPEIDFEKDKRSAGNFVRGH